METVRESFVGKGTYRMMHRLGTVTGSICRGFYFVMPFTRPSIFESKGVDKVAVVVEMPDDVFPEEVQPRAVAEEFVQPVPDEEQPSADDEVAHDIEPAEQTEYQPDVTNDILSGLEFESKVQRMEAEVCVKDFRSKLVTVHKEALGRISRLPKPVAMEILQRLLLVRQDSLRVVQILNALSALTADDALEKGLFMDFLNDENPAVRLTALGAMSKHKDEESFFILSEFLEDTDAQVRRQALNLLSWTFDDKSASAVLTMLHDVDNHVKSTAIYLCASLKLRGAISPLISLLSDPDKDIQERAVKSLRKITDQHFAFKISTSAKNKEKAIQAWRLWWRSNQAGFET